MKWIADLHTHTLLSGHAFSSIKENILGAKEAGLEILANTDHAPGMPGANEAFYHFYNQFVIPEEVDGIRVLKGAEVNIMGEDGSVDLPPFVLSKLDLVIASLHEMCFAPGDANTNTACLLGAIESGWVDIIGHPGNPAYPVDMERVVRACQKHHVVLEINNTSLKGQVRPGSDVHLKHMLTLCQAEGLQIAVGSDAHWMGDVGRLDEAHDFLQSQGYSEDRILNTDRARLFDFLAMRKEVRETLAKKV